MEVAAIITTISPSLVPTPMTKSEQLFQDYCESRRYDFARISVVENFGRFPDYVIQTPNGEVICEVKEINANEQDREFQLAMKECGNADYSRAIGKRARESLNDAKGQLKRYRDDPRPCIVVLFDTTCGGYLSPDDLDAAMFGKPIAIFRDKPSHPKDRRSVFTHGGNRKLTEERGLYVGAVAVLLPSCQEAVLRLEIYHNRYTAKPVWPAYFPDSRDRHFFKDGHPDEVGHEWDEYVGLRAIPYGASNGPCSRF